MKFDRLVKKILLEDLYHHDTFGDSSYIKNPEEALKTLNVAYKFLKNYNAANYDHTISDNPENEKICNAVEVVTVIIKDSNLDTYIIDGKNMDQTTLAKNVIKLASRFGQTEFPQPTAEEDEENARRKAALGGIETRRKSKTIKGPYIVGAGNYPDLEGNAIPNGTQLSGSDYRLCIFAKSGPQLRSHGGIAKIQECYKYLFSIVGLRYQPYNKADEAAERLQDFNNLQYETLYWWGENSLPFRSLITVSDGHVKSVPVPGAEENVGLIQFTSDKVGGHKKARPLSQIGDRRLVGAPHGDVIEGVRVGDPIGEVKQKMESADFEPIRKEKKEVDDLWKAAKEGNAGAKQKLKDALERHKSYLKLIQDGNWKEIKKIYDDRANNYWKVYNDPEKFPGNQRRPPLVDETSMVDAWPFYHIFEDKENGKFGKPLPVSAKTKYEFLYPKNIKEIAQLFYKDIVTQ
jgi:hypothetical protein